MKFIEEFESLFIKDFNSIKKVLEEKPGDTILEVHPELILNNSTKKAVIKEKNTNIYINCNKNLEDL